MTKDKRRRKQQKKKKVETLNRNLKFPKRDSSKSKTGNENSLEFGPIQQKSLSVMMMKRERERIKQQEEEEKVNRSWRLEWII